MRTTNDTASDIETETAVEKFPDHLCRWFSRRPRRLYPATAEHGVRHGSCRRHRNSAQLGDYGRAMNRPQCMSPTATALLSSPAPSFRSTQEVSTALTSTTPGTTTNVLAASNTTTNSLGSTSEIANSLTSNHVIDSAVQAVFTVAQNPAYANLVAGNYISVAAASAQSPTVAAPPIMLEEIKPAIAIPAIAALSLLGTQYGRNGNSASGYRLRAASPNIQVRASR